MTLRMILVMISYDFEMNVVGWWQQHKWAEPKTTPQAGDMISMVLEWIEIDDFDDDIPF